MKRILFYGSIDDERYDKTQAFLSVFIPKLMERGYQIVTREGCVPEPNTHGWLDNLVLDIACNYRDTHALPYDRVISFRLDSATPSKHDRELITLASSERFAGYREMLEKTDMVIAIGGRDGVYRFGLVAAATNHFYLPLSVAGGVAGDKMTRELRDYLTNNYSKEIVNYACKSHFEDMDMEKMINEIARCLNNPQTSSNSAITDEQFISYIENNPEKLEGMDLKRLWKLIRKLPAKVIIPLFAFALTFVVLFVMNIIMG